MKYTTKKKLEDKILNLVTFIVVALNLFPILWMVYVSFMDNNDVMSGKVSMSRRKNDVEKIFTTTDNKYFICTKDGAITVVDSHFKKIFHKNLNTFATSFTEDENYIYLFSADEGVYKFNKKDYKVSKVIDIDDIIDLYNEQSSYKIKLYVTDVVSSSILYYNNKLYMGLWNRKSPGLIVYDLEKEKVSFIDVESQVIKDIKVYNNTIEVLTSYGIAKVDPVENKVIAKLKTANREELVKFVQIDKNFYGAVNITAQKVYIYKEQNNYLVKYKELDNKYKIPLNSIASLIALSMDSSIIIGMNTSGTIVKIPYRIYPVVDTVTPALETPIENAKDYEIVFDSTNVEIIKGVFMPLNDKGGDITYYVEGLNGKAIVGGDYGKFVVLDLISKKHEVLGAFRAPKGKFYIHWRNYIDVFRNIDFGNYLKNSLIICVTVMIIAMILASLAGYSLARYNFPGKDTFGYTILATQMVPGIMFLIPIYLMFVKFNELTGIPVKGTYWSVIFTYSAFFVPFSIWILRGFFAAIPKALEEAALIDGCTPFQAFWRIIIPSAMPGIVATGIYVFLLAWDELMFAWILTNEKTYTIPVGIRNFAGNYQNRYDLMMAAATIATIPVMILFFMMQKQIVAGLTAGAVKE